MKFKEIIYLLMAFMALSVLSSELSTFFWDLSVILLSAFSILLTAFFEFFCA